MSWNLSCHVRPKTLQSNKFVFTANYFAIQQSRVSRAHNSSLFELERFR